MNHDELRWRDHAFHELTLGELYAIIALREQVFVVEQACAYQDADGADPASRHLWAETASGSIAAYLRIVPAGHKFAETSIGRVVIAAAWRGTGLGRALMLRGLACTGAAPLRIGAQAHLEAFYAGLGFVRAADNPDVYDEDGIPHLQMTRA